jgi:mycofactocin precursor
MYEGEQNSFEEKDVDKTECREEEPEILDEILIEELAIDGICGVY